MVFAFEGVQNFISPKSSIKITSEMEDTANAVAQICFETNNPIGSVSQHRLKTNLLKRFISFATDGEKSMSLKTFRRTIRGIYRNKPEAYSYINKLARLTGLATDDDMFATAQEVGRLCVDYNPNYATYFGITLFKRFIEHKITLRPAIRERSFNRVISILTQTQPDNPELIDRFSRMIGRQWETISLDVIYV